MHLNDKILIHEWVYKALEGSISEDESRRLQEALAADPKAIDYYQNCVDINVGLLKIQPILDDSLEMNMCLEEMAQYEKMAQVIKQEKLCPVSERLPIKMAPVAVQNRQTSRVSLYVAIVSTAAMVLMMVYVHLNPRPAQQQVAVLSDTMNAEWFNPEHARRKGDRLMTGQGAEVLTAGVLKLLYDDGVEVVIEAPAEYELLTSTEIALHRGRLFAAVSEAGKGFTVRTQNSRIIDLGTEFGVEATSRGDTELHVFKGRTTLIAGFSKKEKELVEVSAEQARRVDFLNAGIKAIELDRRAFTRSFDSQARTVWRGETVVELADVLSGKLTASNRIADDRNGETKVAWLGTDTPGLEPGGFWPIADNPFISGLFIPNGADSKIAINAEGDLFWEAPSAPLRQRIGFLRFDIRSVSNDRRGAVLSLNLRELVGSRPIAVYGLLDGDLDTWSESELSYANAPGIRPALLGRYQLDDTLLTRLGTMTCTELGINRSTETQLPLDEFIAADTNGLLTLVLICQDSHPSAEWRITAKEGDPSKSPALTFSSGSVPVTIRTADGNGADTYLTNDNQHSTVNTADTHGGETSFRIRNYWKDTVLVTNSGKVDFETAGEKDSCAFQLDRQPVGTPEQPVVALRANAGITFDLQQMRNRTPEQRPARLFTAVCGIPDNILDYAKVYQADYVPSVNVYVLVDGQVRHSQRGLNPRSEPKKIELMLTPADRCLTLAVTGGADQKSPYDWCLFVSPRILFE
jgi:hypothetical protein